MAQRQGAQAAAATAAAANAAAAAAPGGAAAPVALLRPAVMPETFDGTGDWAEYLHYFEQCSRINRSQDPDKVQFLAVHLRGPAQRYYATIPVTRQANWQHLTADMAQRFLPQARRRTAGESLATLADELRKLAVRVCPNMPDQDRKNWCGTSSLKLQRTYWTQPTGCLSMLIQTLNCLGW